MRLARRTLRGSALNALRTLGPKGDGMLQSAQLLHIDKYSWSYRHVREYEYVDKP